MLEEYKKIYETSANVIPGWKQLSKNELCNKYIEAIDSKSPKAENYLSAIICKYWPAISKLYSKSYESFSAESCYEWVIDGIMYALEHRKWLDPESNVYNDPNGPDKIINCCIKSTRLTEYQRTNRHCRKINYQTSSIDELAEEKLDILLPSSSDDYEALNASYAKEIVLQLFGTKEYIAAFILDGIINTDCFSDTSKNHLCFDKMKLLHTLQEITPSYVETFALRYNLPNDLVEKASSYILKSSQYVLSSRIDNTITMLKKKLTKFFQ